LTGLLFSVSELKSEVSSFREFAGGYLSLEGGRVLRQVESDLDNISSSVGREIPWQIAQMAPLRTAISEGEYMRGVGESFVFAEISFKWSLTPVRPSGDTRQAKQVELVGIASTKIRIFEGDPDNASEAEEIAMWRIEIGDANSPGTHFHVQVLGHEQVPPFPKSLDVPRLPSIIVSPFASAEFVISELFQLRWAEHAARESAPMKRWRAIQKERIARQLHWHLEAINDSASSPWTALKLSKPARELFA
jgi:hypothetical protein